MKKVTKTKFVDDSGFSYDFEPVNDEVTIIKQGDKFKAFYLAPDTYPQSPDEWDDCGVFIVNYHRDFWVEKKDIITADDLCAHYHGERLEIEDEYYIFPMSCLVHSGVWLSLAHSFACDSGGWDTSHVGAVLVSKKECPDEKTAEKWAEGQVETWNQYLSGDVYGVVCETFNKDKEQLDQESCWGFYGHESAKEELQSMINYETKKVAEG
jgi:hypothetical protein